MWLSYICKVRKKLKIVYEFKFFKLTFNIIFSPGRFPPMIELRQYHVRRGRREEALMRDYTHALQHNPNTGAIVRTHYRIMEFKFLMIGFYHTFLDLIFQSVAWIYLFVVFRGNMQLARMNPHGNRMLST